MNKYTSGEIAKLAGVSVRTVQFYDTKKLLQPSELSEGGRRLYSDDDLDKLRQICLLKELGLRLEEIKGVFKSERPGDILLLLLEEREKQMAEEIRDQQARLSKIKTIKKSIQETDRLPDHFLYGIEKNIQSKGKLKKVHIKMLVVGIAMDLIQIGTIIMWIQTGIWMPFCIGMFVVVLMGIWMTRLYYRNTEYVCPSCKTQFRPALRAFLVSRHTPKTRRLTCPACGYTGCCIEAAAEEKANKGECANHGKK